MDNTPNIQTSANLIPAATPKPESKKWIIMVITVFMVSALTILGIYVFISNRYKNTSTVAKIDSGVLSPTKTASQEISPAISPELMFTNKWHSYKSSEYGIEISYPNSWQLREKSRVFETGDLISLQVFGSSQKENTEIYDGAGFTLAKPIKISGDLSTWVRQKHGEVGVNGDPVIFSEESIGSHIFQKAYICGLGCFSYYYTKSGDNIIAIMAYTEGPNKIGYEETISSIIKSVILTK